MKIVFVSPFGLQPKSTARVRALPLGAALVARAHEVTLLVPPWDDRANGGKTFTHQGVTVAQVPLPSHPVLDVPVLTARLWQAIHAQKPDILHVFKPKAYSGFIGTGWWLKQKTGRTRVPLVVDTDDWEGKGGWNDAAPYSAPAKALFAWQEQWGLTHNNGVTVASRALEGIVRSMGVPSERILFAPNGPGAAAEIAPATPETVSALRTQLGLEGAPIALLYTRFFEFDVKTMAHRWAKIVQAVPTARLVVVGKGLAGEEVQFHQALQELGVSESVRDVGWQSFEALAPYFALADVALYPMQDTLLNRAKCPVKLADYLQLGLAVVGESVGMVQEYLGEGAGVLIPPGDDGAFVAATVVLLQDKGRAATLGAAALRRMKRFRWSVLAETVEQFYQTLG
jgi:glycosyltransferase involved in cell wall biosynthesis